MHDVSIQGQQNNLEDHQGRDRKKNIKKLKKWSRNSGIKEQTAGTKHK
jgi:hypothetical protein